MSIGVNPNSKNGGIGDNGAMENIIQFNKPHEPEKRCSFCKRKESEVKHLFGSGNAYICGDCVTHAKQRIEEESK